jgi:hypothetical protein
VSLTDEDKKWIRELFEGSMKASEERFRALLEGPIKASEERFREHVFGVETRLLTEFHKWASPMDARIKSHAAALRALDLEQEALDDRVKKLEDKQ